jgi:Carbohydrate family 9 binding domain-like
MLKKVMMVFIFLMMCAKIVNAVDHGKVIQKIIPGKNLFYNSSFELGSKGYGCSTQINSFPGGKIDYKGPAMSLDSTTSSVGKKSLKLVIRPKASLLLNSHEIKLKHKNKYTLSFYAKSNGNKIPLSICFGSVRRGWRTEGRKTIAVKGSNWKRYNFSFTVKHKPVHEHEKYYFLYTRINSNNKESRLWLDGIQLQQGKISEYSPAKQIESAVYSPKTFLAPQTFYGTMSVISYQKTISDYNMSLSLKNDFFDRLVEKQTYKFNLPAGKTITRKVLFKSKHFGSFRMTSGESEDKFSSAYSVRIVKPADKKFAKGFQPGMQSGALEAFRFTPDQQTIYWKDIYGKPGEMAKQVRRTGSTWVNSWGRFVPFYIGLIEPEQNKYNWTFADLYVKNAEKNNLASIIMVPAQSLLTNWRGRDPGKLVPEWFRKLDRFGNPKGSCRGEWKGMDVVLPPAKIIGDLFKAIVKRYGTRVAGYQLFPEANGYMSADSCVDYMKHVYKIIKKLNPKAKFIGLTPTGDRSGGFSGYFKKCLSLGAANYTDAYAYHPYKSRMDNSPVSAMQGNRIMQDINRKHGGGKELWNTELYFLLPVSPKDRYEMGFRADAVARRLLIDMGEGLAVSSPLSLDFFYCNPLLPHQQYLTLFDGLIPSARFAVFSTVARFTTGAKPVRTLEFDDKSILCYLFKNDNKLLSTIWSIRDKKIIKFKLPENAIAVVYDIFGNKIKTAKDQLELKLDRNPLYIEWENVSGSAELIKAIKKAHIESKTKLAIIGPKLIVSKNGQLSAAIIIRNKSSDHVQGKAMIVSRFIGIKNNSVKFGKIPPHGQKIVTFPVKIWTKTPNDFEMNIFLNIDNQVLSFKKIVHRIKRLNVKADRWTKDINISNVICNYQKNVPVQNFGAVFALSRKNNDLLVRVKVRDDQLSQSTDAKSPWESDCVELFMDLNPLGGNLNFFTNHHKKCFHLIIPSIVGGNAKIIRVGASSDITPLQNIKTRIKKTNKGYEMTIRIPLKKILGNIKGQSIGFTMAVNDNDQGKYKYNLTWVGKKNYMNRSRFGVLYFQ